MRALLLIVFWLSIAMTARADVGPAAGRFSLDDVYTPVAATGGSAGATCASAGAVAVPISAVNSRSDFADAFARRDPATINAFISKDNPHLPSPSIHPGFRARQ